MKQNIAAIFVGTSAGGVTALQNMFSEIQEDLRIPVIVVQHLPADAKIELPLVFGRSTKATLEEARDKTPIEPGHIYFAPPGYHLLVERDLSFSLSQDDPVHFARPSIDVLFESAVTAYGAKACGVLLTGANSDGAAGLQALHECGALTFVQDPETAEAPMMPAAALERFKPDLVADLSQIAKALSNLIRGEP